MEATAPSGFEPAQDGGALVSTVVVENQMDIEFGGHLLLQLIEELDELGTAMTRQTTPDDFAVEDVKGGEERRGTVPLVIVGLAFRESGAQGQDRSGSIKSLPAEIRRSFLRRRNLQHLLGLDRTSYPQFHGGVLVQKLAHQQRGSQLGMNQPQCLEKNAVATSYMNRHDTGRNSFRGDYLNHPHQRCVPSRIFNSLDTPLVVGDLSGGKHDETTAALQESKGASEAAGVASGRTGRINWNDQVLDFRDRVEQLIRKESQIRPYPLKQRGENGSFENAERMVCDYYRRPLPGIRARSRSGTR